MADADRPSGRPSRPGRAPQPRPPQPGPPQPRPPRRRTLLGAAFYWILVLGVWAAICVVGAVAFFARGLPDTSRLVTAQRQPSISYLDRSGSVIAVRGGQAAPPVNLDALPAYVPGAFVAVEDRRFYQHMGFDLGGIVRSVLYNATHHGGPLRGGSTITQQLARNLFLTRDQNAKRKVQELILAVELERRYSKKEILALYLNRVDFGAGATGIEAAAQRYFNKPARDLSIGESALLAGLLKAPTRYSPVNDQDRAAARATIVLDKMVETHVITPDQEKAAFDRPVIFSKTLNSQHAQYFIDWVDAQVRQIVAQQTAAQTGVAPADQAKAEVKDLVVETTLDLPIDAAAEVAARQIVARDGGQGVRQAAVVALDGSGRVRALVGGVDYAKSQFDRAVDARRQAGSSWKPFVYLAAMEAGRTPNVEVVDEPITINGWSPHNYTNRFLGPITLQTALSQSINTVAARLADEVGRDNVAAVAHRLGITSTINTDPAMALGTTGVSPLEMAQAYAPLANGGYAAPAYGIERIRTADGQVIFQHQAAAQNRVVSEPALSYMTQMMRQVLVAPGTGARAAIPGYDLAGKTGTTSDYRDAWFVGFTGGFVTAVWVGKDDNTPMRKVTGGGPPAELWRAFMSAALPRLAVGAIPAGPNPPAPTAPSDPIGDLLNRTGENGEGDPLAPNRDPGATMAPIPNPPSFDSPTDPTPRGASDETATPTPPARRQNYGAYTPG